MNNYIEINNLYFEYEKEHTILENITLNVEENDFLAIIGPNGGGKSTLLKLILGLLKPKSGTIKVNIDKNYLGYVPQNTNLNINFPITALEVVLMGHIGGKKKLFGYTKEETACAMNSLKQVSMQEYAHVKIGNLSGGQRQRVFIARALCANPKVILLDEPTASIDVQGQQEVYDLLKILSKTVSIVVVSHDISILLHYAKNVAHINKTSVYHTLEGIKNLPSNETHLCEVELLSALGNKHSCGCK
ncbi:MAG: metal ABC transporter ATP-binding protein [Arcobacteraceae bacterium]